MLLSTTSLPVVFAPAEARKSSGVQTSERMLRLRCLLAVLDEYECDEVGDVDLGEENCNSFCEWPEPQVAKVELAGPV